MRKWNQGAILKDVHYVISFSNHVQKWTGFLLLRRSGLLQMVVNWDGAKVEFVNLTESEGSESLKLLIFWKDGVY